MALHIVSYRDTIPPNCIAINTTSRSKDFGKGLSPFLLGPVDLYGGQFAYCFENAWQYAKLYPQHADANGDPTPDYFTWAKSGWKSQKGERYPMGKGVIPLCSLWDARKLDYVQARKQIYVPLYAKAVKRTAAFGQLKNLYQTSKQDIYLVDFDGYNHRSMGLSYEQVVNDPQRKMGHAFVLGMLLEGLLS